MRPSSKRFYRSKTDVPAGGYEARIAEIGAANPSDRREFESTKLKARADTLVFRDAKRRAEQGQAEFQYWVGKCYRVGWGVARDLRLAAEWFRKAAQQDHAMAANQLGDMYHGGDGVAKDDAEAVQWFRRSAELGEAAAQFNLGGAYALGKGVSQDPKEAFKWNLKAAEAGRADAQAVVGTAYALGKGVKQDYALAEQWYRKAAAQGNANAQTDLGYQYQFGLGVKPDYEEAAKWYRLAAEQGKDEGKRLLAGLERTIAARQQANSTLDAAERGDPEACEELGRLYERGEGVPRDVVAAYVWYSLAGNRPYSRARVQFLRAQMSPGQESEAMGRVVRWRSRHRKPQ